MCDPDFQSCSILRQTSAHQSCQSGFFNGASAELPHILVYGASWCPDCVRAQKVMDSRKVLILGRVTLVFALLFRLPALFPFSAFSSRFVYPPLQVPYEYLNTDLCGRPNIGRRRIPTIVFPDGSFLQEPSNQVLSEKLSSYMYSSK